MAYKKYFKKGKMKESIVDIKKQIIDFFVNNSEPTDKQKHDLADKLDIDIHLLNNIIDRIMGSMLNGGRAKGYTGNYDTNEVKLGLKMEMKYIGCPYVAQKLVYDKLADFPKYYTYLMQLEEYLKEKK